MFFITIEGNIGAGKTTLAKILSKELNASLLLEKFEENPHLEDFYKNPKQHALPAELWFLSERCKQMDSFFKKNKNNIIISDYNIGKCIIFAKANLNKEKFLIYKRFYENIISTFPRPNLLIFLQQDTKQLIDNIRKRGRGYEKEISSDYLNTIQKGYESYIKQKKEKEALILDCSRIDLHKKKDVEHILALIKRTIGC